MRDRLTARFLYSGYRLALRRVLVLALRSVLRLASLLPARLELALLRAQTSALRAALHAAARLSRDRRRPPPKAACTRDGVRVLCFAPLDGAAASPAPAPAILFVHGGAFCLHVPTEWLAALHLQQHLPHSALFAVDYPLLPEALFAHQLAACESAYRYVRKMGYEQVVIVGDSAGGNLALNLALSLSQDPGERAVLVCCVVISPWLMVERAVQATADPATDFLSYAWLGRHARAYADAGGPGLSHMVRALADCARTAPCLCVMGGDELLRPDAEPLVPIDLCAAPPSRESLNRPLLYAEPGESHDWLLLPPGSALLRDPEALERGWLAVASFIKLALATVPDRARRRRQ